MHLAHVTGWGYNEIMDMPIDEIGWWCGEAVKYWNKLNEVPDTTD